MLNDNCTTDTVAPMLVFVEELTKCSKPMEEEFYDAYEQTFLHGEQVKSHITSCSPGEQVLFCTEQRENDDEDETVLSMETLYSSIAASVESFSTLGYLCGADRLIHAAQREPFCGYVMKDRESNHLDDNNDVRSAVTFRDVLPKESNPVRCGFGLDEVRFQPKLERTNSVKVRVKLNPTPAKRIHWFPSEISPSEDIRDREPSLNYIPYEVHNGFIPRSGDDKKEKVNSRDCIARFPNLSSPRHRIQKSFAFRMFDSPLGARGLLGITSLEGKKDSNMFSSSAPSTKARGRCIETTDCHQERTTLFEQKILPPAASNNIGGLKSEHAIENSIISALGSYDSVGQHINDERKEVRPKKLPTEIVVQTCSKPNAVVVVVDKEDDSSYCLSKKTHEGHSQNYEDHNGNNLTASLETYHYDTVEEGKSDEMKLDVELTSSADKDREKCNEGHLHGLNIPPPYECPQNENSRISSDGPSLKAVSIDSISTPVAQAHSCSGSHCALMSHSSAPPVNDHALPCDPKSEEEEGCIRSIGTNTRSDPQKINDAVLFIEETSDETQSFRLADGVSPDDRSTSTIGLNSSTSLKPTQMLEDRDDVEQAGGEIARKDESFEHFTIEESPRSDKTTVFLTEQTQPVTNESPSLAQHSRSSSCDSLILINYEDIDKVSSPTQKREVLSECFESRPLSSSFHASAAAKEGETSGNDVNIFLMKYATTIGKDKNILSAIGSHKDVVQTHEEAAKRKKNFRKGSDKNSHWTTAVAKVNESRDENHQGSTNDPTVSPSYIHSQMREDPVISLNEVSLKKERSGKKNNEGSTNQFSRPPYISHSENREDSAGRSIQHASKIVFSNAALEIQTKQGRPIASSEIIDPYLIQKNLYHGSRRNLPESTEYKIIGKDKKISTEVNLESNSKIERKQQVANWGMPSSRYFSAIKQHDNVIDYNQTERSDYRKDEKEEHFSRNPRGASYQIGPRSLEEPRLLSKDEGRYAIPLIDPPNVVHNEQMSSASASGSLGLYSSTNPMHGLMHHSRNHLEQSEDKGRKDEFAKLVFSRSIVAPRINGSMALSHINLHGTGSGHTDDIPVSHPRERQGVANSSPYIELHNGLQELSPNINRYKDSDKYEPPSLSPQTDERKNEQIPFLGREAHGNQGGGVSRYSKNTIEAFRERILDVPQDFMSHKSLNHEEISWGEDKVTPSLLIRQTNPNLAGAEAENLRNKTGQQSLLRPKETTAAIDDNERNLIIQRTLEYALSLSKSKEMEPPKSFNVSKVSRDHLTQQAETELHEFRPESYELEKYKFHPELIKESVVKRRTRAGIEQYRNQPELVQAYSIKKSRKLAVKKSNRVRI